METENTELTNMPVVNEPIKKDVESGILGYNLIFFLIYAFPVFMSLVQGWSFRSSLEWGFYISSVPFIYFAHLATVFFLMAISFYNNEKQKGFGYLGTFFFLLIFLIPIQFLRFIAACGRAGGC